MLFVPSIPVIYNRVHVYQGAGGGHGSLFNDTFTGANGSSPAAAWTQNPSGWQIQNNRLEFAGASYSIITRNGAVGDLTFDWDQDFGNAGSTFAIYICRYIDANNYLYFQLNGSDVLTFNKYVAGVATLLSTDSVTRCGSGAGPCHGQIVISGNNISLIVTGGAQTPGTFGPISESTHAATGQGLGFGMNTAKAGDYFDNAAAAN